MTLSASLLRSAGATNEVSLSATEIELRTLTVEGILSVQAGDNPRVVADKLTSFVPPALRDGAGEGDNVTPMPEREAEAA